MWTHNMTGAHAAGVVVDGAGNVVTAGMTLVNIDGNQNSGGTDVAWLKFAPNGTMLATRIYGSSKTNTPLGLALANDNAVIVVGYTEGPFGGSGPAGSGIRAFAMRIAADGTLEWTSILSQTAGAARGVAFDPTSNETVVVGDSNNLPAYWLVAADGTTRREAPLSTSPGDGQAVASDPDHRDVWFVAGGVRGSIQPGSQPLGTIDAFLLRLNTSSGEVLQATQFGGPGDDRGRSVAVASDGSVYVAGDMNWYRSGAIDGYVSRHDGTSCRQLWLRQWVTPALDWAWDVVAHPLENLVLVVGETAGTWVPATAASTTVWWPPTTAMATGCTCGSGTRAATTLSPAWPWCPTTRPCATWWAARAPPPPMSRSSTPSSLRATFAPRPPPRSASSSTTPTRTDRLGSMLYLTCPRLCLMT